MLKAVIFDLDGTLVDSEKFWLEAELEVFGTLGFSFTAKDIDSTFGLKILEVVKLRYQQKPWKGQSIETVTHNIEEGVRKRISARAELMPGALDAIQALENAGCQLAVASSSAMSIISAALERLNLQSYFKVVVSAETEPLGKPHPGVYLKAASILKLEPHQCLAVEDTLHGLVAAKAAGMKAIIVPAMSDPKKGGYQVLADFELASLKELRPLLQTHANLWAAT